MKTIPPEQLLADIEDVIRTMPPNESLGNDTPDVLAWLGRASAVVHARDSPKAILMFDNNVSKLSSSLNYTLAVRAIHVMLHQARHDLRMKTVGPLSVAIPTGAPFDYFDELRQAIEMARSDLLFIDPYLDAEFVSRYLPHVSSGVVVRLLGREKMSSLISAVHIHRQQSPLVIELRSAQGFHDRYMFTDGVTCHQSGASFKDGAKKAPTTLTQITDAFVAMRSTYETLWSTATIHP